MTVPQRSVTVPQRSVTVPQRSVTVPQHSVTTSTFCDRTSTFCDCTSTFCDRTSTFCDCTSTFCDCTSTFCLQLLQQNLLFFGECIDFYLSFSDWDYFHAGENSRKRMFLKCGSISFLYLLNIEFCSNCYNKITAGNAHGYWIPLLFHHSQAMWNPFYCLYFSCLLPRLFHVVFILLLEFAISTLQCCCLPSYITFLRTSQYLI